MKRLLALTIAVACFALPASYAQANNGGSERNFFDSFYCFFFSCETQQDQQSQDQAWDSFAGASSSKSVPELDGAGAPVAAALIAGLIGLGIERRRRKAKA